MKKKTIKTIITILAGTAIITALFFSCEFFNANDGHGTLVLRLPGNSSSRAVISPNDFAAHLIYRVECKGSTTIRENLRSDRATSMRLPAGEYNVTITVYNSADMDVILGSAGNTPQQQPITVAITAGETTRLDLTEPIRIKTDECKATRFTLIDGSTRYSRGYIDHEYSTITVFIRDEDEETSITGSNELHFDITHSGASTSPAKGKPVSFDDLSEGITVYAVNGSDNKNYTVKLEVMPIGNYYFSWDAIPWSKYGLSGLQQPSDGNFWLGVEYEESDLGFTIAVIGVYFSNATSTDHEHLTSELERLDFSHVGNDYYKGNYYAIIIFDPSENSLILTCTRMPG